jgi:cbb3-type cytochrome oxidase maturation protein
MEALYLLIPLSVAWCLCAWVFFHASDDGQFDDLVGPGAARAAGRRHDAA